MEWLSQNWLWIVVAVGFFFLMTRMHGMGHGMGHSRGHGHGRHGDHSSADGRVDTGTAIDPVSRRAVATGSSSISAVYRGSAYYFENRENRDAFEADPAKYAAGTPGAGQVIGLEEADRERPRRRHGC